MWVGLVDSGLTVGRSLLAIWKEHLMPTVKSFLWADQFPQINVFQPSTCLVKNWLSGFWEHSGGSTMGFFAFTHMLTVYLFLSEVLPKWHFSNSKWDCILIFTDHMFSHLWAACSWLLPILFSCLSFLFSSYLCVPYPNPVSIICVVSIFLRIIGFLLLAFCLCWAFPSIYSLSWFLASYSVVLGPTLYQCVLKDWFPAPPLSPLFPAGSCSRGLTRCPSFLVSALRDF